MIKVYDSKKKTKQEMFLMLDDEDDDCVVLRMVYADGTRVPAGNILEITPKGIILYGAVNPDAPFQLDHKKARRILLRRDPGCP